ncbi:DUF1893 domain-containing protein [Terrisporobacter sp.]|uniref:DUF1893 domain-containing protein n=1 Tax=Terrisporobacter sp. TaxID=1965305 RepID=UPI0026334608|nr:DUF1893 domain-containing protein [Terrisporobacter sp.]
MNKEIFDKVVSKEYLLVITDTKGNILFKTEHSPVSQFYQSYYKKEIDLGDKEIFVYSNQIGVALATLSELENVVGYIGNQISEPAKYLINQTGIKYDYNEQIDLVKSSKDSSKVCPIEECLYKMEDVQDKIKFLEGKYK